jgi:Domain of unknown function (DUF3883)
MASDTKNHRVLLETEALVVGYAMSRLDGVFLHRFGWSSWRKAFEDAGRAIGVRPASLKNLRDEFDPFHDNGRRGWHGRALRTSRFRIIEELKDLSDDAVLELASRLVERDHRSAAEAIRELAGVDRVTPNVAERLLTGRRAEEYFIEHCERIVAVPFEDLVDSRLSAAGFDFSFKRDQRRVVEVKGIKGTRGNIQFTDREWAEAATRRGHYLLVIVGNLARTPRARVLPDPRAALRCESTYQTRVAVVWNAPVTI